MKTLIVASIILLVLAIILHIVFFITKDLASLIIGSTDLILALNFAIAYKLFEHDNNSNAGME